MIIDTNNKGFHNGNIKKCICIKKDQMIDRETCINITHNVGDICECMELLNGDNELIGYYVKYDIFRYRIFDFYVHYKICAKDERQNSENSKFDNIIYNFLKKIYSYVFKR